MSPVLVYPNPTLREVSKELPSSWWYIKSYLKKMKDALETMRAMRGAGISGIQIGEAYRFFWMLDEQGNVELAANPSFVPSDKSLLRYVREGCLSFPSVWGTVKRYNNILATYERSDSSLSKPKLVDVELTGLKAHVFQHECEHLDGKLFIDNLFPSEREKLLRQLRAS